ncbi:YajG family lipoprotein [Alishewanella sp. 16-MA]|uniref:YajG family lipoprotein n=2 Tax=Gammaproteobacteria TaxID=1236 RepID=A0ABS8BZH9_9ALTE|nr:MULTISPECIES: YajG family lipoprotein [Gammaproteobacteria]MDP4946022.1 YajG family lipoprotein [Alishewanella sp.]MCB5225476.1 YajG family lipoprotein [Alishewanella maricola]MCC5451403.1 YajG family lipoprotein [Rheinheimera sp. UJ51]MDP5036639.1 YajG family lipoprotein [Alishewanella sp.]MDP5188056.1 YajG family lipoprotein [Alishewanella sp.]
MRYLSLVLLLLVAGCATKVPSFIVAPQIFWPQTTELSGRQFSFAVVDLRPRTHSLTIQQGGNENNYRTSNDVRFQLEKTVAAALTEQGANLLGQQGTQLKIQINQLQANVQQRPLDHLVTNQVALTIFIQRDDGSFTKSYAGDSSYTAPFKVDLAAVERELRILTEQVLNQLLQDPTWKSELN